MELPESRFRVQVRANASKSHVDGFDAEKRVYKISINAPAQDNLANKELVKFLSKELKKRVHIKSGLHSKIKTIQVE